MSKCPNCYAELHSTRFVCAACGWSKGDVHGETDHTGVDIGSGLKVSAGRKVPPIKIPDDYYGDAA